MRMISIVTRGNSKILFSVSILFLLASFAIAIIPEPPARLLTPREGWDVHGADGSLIHLSTFPDQLRQVRDSAIRSSGGVLFRSWTPEHGFGPIDVTSPPFHPARYMSVAITGTNRISEGFVQAFIECEPNKQRMEVFRGGVNVNAAEAIIVSPEGWCQGNARLKLSSTQKDIVGIGVGAVFEISRLSYLKSSFIGHLPYLIISLALFTLIMFAGACLARLLGWSHDILPVVFVSLGISALGVFYLANIIPVKWRSMGGISMSIVAVVALLKAGREVRNRAAFDLLPYVHIWVFASLVYYAILGLAGNGVGHWEPNYRFWPASWSSDNELHWKFAEAISKGWRLADLLGSWSPTDRPPLMVGADLLVREIFKLLQFGNDGVYMRGHAYNAAAVALNALWAPACWWLLVTWRRGIDDSGSRTILLFVGCLPFVLFNTIYGWPKAFGAAFALVAFGLAWRARGGYEGKSQQTMIILFFLLGAFSMLSHASTLPFLVPLGFMFYFLTPRQNLRAFAAGLVIALVVVATWSLYKTIVLPSEDPIAKYALTGDFGFGNPGKSLWKMLSERYDRLTIRQWIDIKRIMLFQSFLPINHSVTQYLINSEFGADAIDKLRAWDFMMLSKGNLPVPLLTIVAGYWTLKAAYRGCLRDARAEAPFLVLIGVSLVAWLLMVLGFLAPVVIGHWPQAGLFGLAVGSAVIAYSHFRPIFWIMLLALLTYTGLVWILSPLYASLSVDAGAAIVLLLLCLLALDRGLFLMPSLQKKLDESI